MTNKTTMPEPVAFRWRVPIVDSDGRQCGESDWKFGTEKGGHPWWTRDNLITTTQAEAYANDRVREALEGAEKELESLYTEALKARVSEDDDDESWNLICISQARSISLAQLRIRALIPTTKA